MVTTLARNVNKGKDRKRKHNLCRLLLLVLTVFAPGVEGQFYMTGISQSPLPGEQVCFGEFDFQFHTRLD